MRNKVCRFLRAAAGQFSEDALEVRRIYKDLKKAHSGSSTKEKHMAYTVMLKPEILEDVQAEWSKHQSERTSGSQDSGE